MFPQICITSEADIHFDLEPESSVWWVLEMHLHVACFCIMGGAVDDVPKSTTVSVL